MYKKKEMDNTIHGIYRVIQGLKITISMQENKEQRRKKQ